MVSTSQASTQNLEKQQQLLMMKKLLVAVCRNYWERDRVTLLSTSIKELITELQQSYPSFNEVKQKLYQVVNQLNKREKYFPIAIQLIKKLSQLYGEVTEETQASLNQLEAHDNSVDIALNQNSKIANILKTFEQDQNSQRIHKMLFALTQKCWENNPETLSNYPIQQLIQNIYQIYPSLEPISFNLLKIVKRLNKQGIYSQITKTIIAELAKLYPDQEVEQLTSLVNVSNANLISSKNTPSSVVAFPKVETETRKHNFAYNPYQVRQGIMKYANPLRTKILLFCTLHSNKISSQQEIDSLLLKTYELDQMVMQLVQKFRTIQQLQNNLETTAFSIVTLNNQMLNTDENLKIVKAIVTSVKPLYETN
ncbi:MAG: hypothetical protein BRC33_10755 [Cyanobacteria bacterium SW_9_44_58]|nr:MAG: hypothetical protein BRC33_10755 [Cyanobacteria bacterium SW_9_44_58]